MTKRYKLKPEIKEHLIFGIVLIIFFTFIFSVLWIVADKNEKIDSGKILLIKQEY